MKILYIIPGFDEGGAEFHTLNLIRELVNLNHGHEFTLISSGGRLEADLPEGVHVFHLPVDRKNLFTGIYSAAKIINLHKNFHWDIIHVHSRVPAWIAWIISSVTRIPFIMTAHALYSLNAGLIPLKHAAGIICVSRAVQFHLQSYLPHENIVIPNGIITPRVMHKDSNHDGVTKFLFVGRLTRLKGVDVILRALSGLVSYNWTLEILGDGPQREELENLAADIGIKSRVKFYGAVDKSCVEEFMSKASCLLFPSYQEGMGLVVIEALSIGLPVIASDLEALREISDGELIPAGNVEKWRCAVRNFIVEKIASPLNSRNIITVHDMAAKTENYYKNFIPSQ